MTGGYANFRNHLRCTDLRGKAPLPVPRRVVSKTLMRVLRGWLNG